MSSLAQPKQNQTPNPHINEKEWVIHIARTLEEELEEDESDNPVTIFIVPRPLKEISPESYIPHQVAIGPFHSARTEIQDMGRYKVAAAKRNQKDFPNLKLKHLVKALEEIEPKIRASYQKLLDLSGETLAWMMAVDASFLLEFLQVCAIKKNKATSNVLSSRLLRLEHLGGNKAAHNAILRDVCLVENQIPLFVLRRLLQLHFSSPDKGDEMLFSMFVGACDELSPFKMVENSACDNVELTEFHHLLDFLYHFVVPKSEDWSALVEEDDTNEEDEDSSTNHETKCASKLFVVVTLFKKVIFSKPVRVVVKLPWTILSNLPMLKAVKEPLENFFGNISEDEEKKDEDSSSETVKFPLLEEIEIPSVTKLVNAGVQFQATNQGISSISFNTKTRVFNLPTISLNVNSGIVLRNLVAYEICHASGPLILTRYTELMNGIIDTEEDAKYLREKGIVVNRLKSDAEVADMWNGMSKSIKLTKVAFLDKVIEDVNKDYSGRWKVKIKRCVKSYVFKSWKILTLLGALLLILLMALQAFCSVYNCARLTPLADGFNS